ncbi:MAG: ATP-binding cassette domain-containing protein [Bacteroidales bacterium]|nr:ATP-binding cassette domain-containing protein [Bacteroidales bacterium]MDD2204456.1 ATP-binding cassette domain-containing protein [Bacteroidales bacterium]MDD3151955.1 ATP-binding cassette domain-containing protein [Bacteroidales bacterium]MDD3913958.1 ATP-binding cassette domain-containing protein [Bacteroidales bacterium]MDD4633750.1 ATP-binding cassette domain-containing protein [Bacteroidales bacterium]
MDIEVKNFTKKYGNQKAVDNISFKVKTGEVLGFLGPNGAGKTTTMKAITTYFAPSSGEITIGKYSVTKEPEKVKPLIGYLPESNPLYQDMAVLDYLRYSALLQGVKKSDVDERLLEMVTVCGLEREKYKNINELSKGYKQRVGLAQALIHDPEVLILDEPTSGLDPNQIMEIRELIKRIGREKTVILSSHILAEVEATCDRILIISKGKIVADGTADELRKHSKDAEVLTVQIEDGNPNEIFKAIAEISTVISVDFVKDFKNKFEIHSNKNASSKREIFNTCVKNNWILTEMSAVETKLEDIFKELTSN